MRLRDALLAAYAHFARKGDRAAQLLLVAAWAAELGHFEFARAAQLAFEGEWAWYDEDAEVLIACDHAFHAETVAVGP